VTSSSILSTCRPQIVAEYFPHLYEQQNVVLFIQNDGCVHAFEPAPSNERKVRLVSYEHLRLELSGSRQDCARVAVDVTVLQPLISYKGLMNTDQ
jgi:hypothetical protein